MSGDDVTVSGGSAAFTDKNVGQDKTVNVAGLNISGDDSGNYTVSIAGSQADITPKELSVSGTASDKEYDGNRSADVEFSLTGVISGDTVTANTSDNSFEDKNVGDDKTVTSTNITLAGGDSGNYTLANTTTTDLADITPKQITVTGTAADKVYDSTVNADITAGTSDFIATDNISLTGASGSFSDKNVADDKDVTIGGYSLSGDDAGNYEIANSTVVVQADITPFEITASSTADDKTYDGNNSAEVDLALSGVFSGDTVTVSSTSDTFDDKNAGENKTVTSSGVTLGGIDGGNYVLTETTLTDTADIFKKDVTVTASVEDKIYDGTTTADFDIDSSGTIISGDDVTIAGSNANFSDKNVGENKAVTFGDLTISGDDKDNYNITIANTDVTADITAKQITVTGTAADKVYDSTVNADITASTTDFIATDNISLTGASGSFFDKNVADDKDVTIGGYSLSGDDAGNYEIANSTVVVQADITPFEITASSTADDKTYDGNNSAEVDLALSGVFSGDTVTVSSTSDTFDDKNAGENKTVTSSGVILGGIDGGNYVLAETTLTDTADIFKKDVTVTASVEDKIYDGTTVADFDIDSSGTIIGGDDVTIAGSNANFSDKNVGEDKSVTFGDLTISGDDKDNYNITIANTDVTADITAKQITVTGTATDKVYDSTRDADITASTTDFIASDDISLVGASGSFSDKNVADDKDVTIGGYSLSGDDAGNYEIANSTVVVQADITPFEITASSTAENKTYDGNDSADVDLALSGVYSGDTVTVNSASDTFDDKNAGENKTVTSSGVTLGGTDGGNYVLAETTLTDTADIFKKDVTVTASVEDKIYDGTTTADFDIDSSGTIISGDDVTIAGSNANFSDKNVGEDKSVSFGDLSISGDDKDNYNITIANTDVTADITPKQITVTGTAADKIYDGNTSANVELELTGVISGDTVAVSSSSDSFSDKNVGVEKTVTSTGITLSGSDGGNYVLAETTISDTADINVKDVSVNVNVADKEYDGTTIASFNIDSNGEIITGDDVSISSGTANFDDKNVGQNKAVSFGDLNISGSDASNYNITIANTDASADINAKTITVNSTASDKTYDGSTQADVSLELEGIIAGDTVLVGASGSAFDDKNAGSNKTVTTEGLVLSGLDSGNYVLASDSSTDNANIFAKEISVSTTASDKVYDGTTVATVDFNLTGLEEGDIVNASSASNNFDDANAAIDINVSSTDIELSGADAGNYVLSNTDSNSTADITPADLTIRANDDSQESGPAYSGGNGFTATGFVSGESIANLNGEASYGGSSQGAASPGNYNISISGFESQNYNINFVDGNLEISLASNSGEGANNPVAPGGGIPPQISAPGGLGIPLGPTASGGEGDEGSVDSLLEGDLLVFGGGSKRPGDASQLGGLEDLCAQEPREVELEQCPDDSTPGK